MAQQPYYPAEVESPQNILNVNGMWYYTSNHFDSCGSTTPYEPYDCVTFVKGFNLWKSNGTPAGTHKIRSFSFSADLEDGGPDEIPDDAFIPFNNSLVYIGARDPYSFSLEKIDNNSTTHVELKYFSYNRSAYNFEYQFTQAGNLLYFVANNSGLNGIGNYGTELWKTDGTPQGTVMVKDIRPGSPSSNPYGLKKDINNKILYFTAHDGTGNKLWQSDGTTSGTVPAVRIIPAPKLVEFQAGSRTQMHLSWRETFQDNTVGFDQYDTVVVERSSTINGPFARVAAIPYWGFTYADNNLTPNTTYYYRLKGIKANLHSPYTSVSSATTHPEVTSPLNATKQWDKLFANFYPYAALGTSSGQYLIFSNYPSNSLTLLNSNGEPIWTKPINGKFSQITATTDGNYLLSENIQIATHEWQLHLVKINGNGNILWDKTLNEHRTTIIATSDGGFLIGSYSTQRNDDYRIIKLSSNAEKQWEKTFGGNQADNLSAVIQTSDGGYLLGGKSYSGIGGDKTEASLDSKDDNTEAWKNGTGDYWVVKISANGSKEWDRTLGGEFSDNLIQLVQAADGGYLLGGNSKSFSSDRLSCGQYEGEKNENLWLVKISSNGTKLWEKSLKTESTFGVGNAPHNDLLVTLQKTADGGFLIGSTSDSGKTNNKSESSRGMSEVACYNDGYSQEVFYTPDYWLIKLSNGGDKLWDKTFGSFENDYLGSVIQNPDGSYLLVGSTYSTTANDGDKTQAGTGTWVIKTKGTIPPTVTCSATGSILREKWVNVTGNSVSAIPVNTAPASSSQLTSFESASNQGDNYGERIRGYLCVPASGSYTFYIAGDDKCELWLSTDDDPSKKTKIAVVSAYTGVRVWNKYAEQKSAAISLVAGKKYYIEALHKESTGGDNLAVGWQTPTQSTISVIPGSVLSPFVVHNTGKITREFWANVTGYQISNIPLTTAPTTTDELTIFETAANQGNTYGQRFRGYIHPQVSGNYRFYIAGDDKVELYLSSDEDPAKKTRIASITAPTSLRQWNKYASQQSIAISLVAGRKYYIEALHKENTGDDHVSVGWQLPSQTTISVIAGTYLSPFLGAPAVNIARVGVEESLESNVRLYPNPFESKLTIATQQAGKHYISVVDNLGRIVYQSVIQAETELNLTHLKAGVYMVKVSTEDGQTQVKRIVKK
ncbi:T9SS type A sorting domain-containing protein [Rhodocytophaga rosea]|uniref:T9SS type A sorting domain-containing protein n=1 Tax=Rhodocytophaga rosea TaxID=2704465 RepID=A0A6C0GQW7_9BACT|nr:PA14 domain-containing protein [Rhodocytophaga rosea]QHT70451.1 T9SS type A sorting domain-containing protein [Rhodocytophaga rosea]